MAVAYVATANDGSPGVNASSADFPFNPGSLTNGVIAVGIGWQLSGTVSSVSVDGNACSQVSGAYGTVAAGTLQNSSDIWRRAVGTYAPGSVTVSVTMSAGVFLNIGAVSASGVDQTTPIGNVNKNTSAGANNTITAGNVAATTDDLIFGTCCTDQSNTLTASAPSTDRWVTTVVFNLGYAAGATAPGASNVNMTWTTAANTGWAASACVLKAVAAGFKAAWARNSNQLIGAGTP